MATGISVYKRLTEGERLRLPFSTLGPVESGEPVRYSFLVGIFHPRLHAGLSRTLALPCGRGSAWRTQYAQIYSIRLHSHESVTFNVVPSTP
jgi:hypothetical protein